MDDFIAHQFWKIKFLNFLKTVLKKTVVGNTGSAEALIQTDRRWKLDMGATLWSVNVISVLVNTASVSVFLTQMNTCILVDLLALRHVKIC